MKAMNCRELGGACDLEFHAETFLEIARMSQNHGREMFQKGDQPHLGAMNKMMVLMQSDEAMGEWMAAKQAEFEAKPNHQ